MAATSQATKDQVANLNSDQLMRVDKAVRKLGPDATIKAVGVARSIFNHAIGALTCRNCGYTNPPALLEQDLACCLNCGLSQEITLYVGPLTPPVIEEPTPAEQVPAEQPTVDLTENG